MSSLSRKGTKNGMYGVHRFGIANPFYGKKHSEATKLKIRQAKLGKAMSERQKRKISEALKGRKPTWLIGKTLSDEHRKHLSEASKGKPKSATHCKNMRATSCRGAKRWNWKGGITPTNVKIRASQKYRLWRQSVFTRDNYTCVLCGARSQKGKKVILNADHIKSFASFPKLRFAINNGRTLCVECHK